MGYGTDVEDSGIIYSELFTDNDSRVKYINETAYGWWLRSAYTGRDDSFYGVFYFGYSTRDYANFARGVALSFCF